MSSCRHKRQLVKAFPRYLLEPASLLEGVLHYAFFTLPPIVVEKHFGLIALAEDRSRTLSDEHHHLIRLLDTVKLSPKFTHKVARAITTSTEEDRQRESSEINS